MTFLTTAVIFFVGYLFVAYFSYRFGYKVGRIDQRNASVCLRRLHQQTMEVGRN